MLQTVTTVIKSYLLIFFTEIINKIFMFIFTILLARFLGSTEFGKFAFAMAFVGIAMSIADLGLSLLITKEVSKDNKRADYFLSAALTAKVFLSIVMVVFVWLYIKLTAITGDLVFVLLLLTFGLAFESFSMVYISIFRAFKQMKYEATVKIIRSSIYLFAGAALLINQYGIIGVSLLFLGLNIVTFLLILYINKRYEFASFQWSEFDVLSIFPLIKKAWPYAILTIFVSIYFKIDMVILQHLRGPYEVGQYAAAYKILEGVLLLSLTFSWVIFPVMSELYHSSKERLEQLVQTSLKIFIAVSIPIAITISFLSNEIINYLYGNEYPEAVIALIILIWSVIPIFISSITITLINSSDHPKISSYVAGLQVITNIVLNLLLIPKYGLIGAAIVTLITESANVLWHCIYIRKRVYRLTLSPLFIKPVISVLIMGGIIYLLPSSILLIPVYMGVYFLFLIFFKGITLGEIGALKAAILQKG